MDIAKLIQTLHPLERKVLPILEKTNSFDEIAKQAKLQKVEVMRALQWLQNKKIISLRQELKEIISLDENGIKYREKGLPEKKFLSILETEIPLSSIPEKTGLGKDEIGMSIGLLKQKNAIEVKAGKEPIIKITEQGKKLLERKFPEEELLKKKFPIDVKDLNQEEKSALENLKKRRKIVNVDVVKEKIPSLTELGKKIVKEGIKGIAIADKLTASMLKSDLWEGKTFRRYDVKINVPSIYGGKRHFVSQAISYIKRIWLDLGFKEMTGNMVQTSFWDLDALFVPQDHPARDMQDTFYIKDPKYGKLPKELMKKIMAVHENGWTTGSKGWRYMWSGEIAKENLLRTHTTVLSAQAISKLLLNFLPACDVRGL